MLSRYLAYLLVATILLPSLPQNVYAQSLSFNPSSVIADSDFFRIDDISAAEIASFLQRKGSALANYRTIDIDGVEKSAADIIFRAAHDARINPKVLLVLLQKEQSLIEGAPPSQYSFDWATGYSRCDSCQASDPGIASNKGFTMQVQKAAARKRYYIEHPEQFQFRVGEAHSVDGQTVTPANLATAALYNYTPHIRGNFSFWKLWFRYFEKFYPDGTLAQEKNNKDIWLIQDGVKRKFGSLGVFLSRYSPERVIMVQEHDLDKYPAGSPIRFPQYSLLQSKKGAIFLVVDDKKYGIPSRAIFRSIGFNADEVIRVSDADIQSLEDGGLILSPAHNPVEELFQDSKTGGVFVVDNGTKHPILEKATLTANYPYQKIVRKNSTDLEKFKTGDPILFADGTLVASTTDTAVYIISNGTKRPFLSGDVFELLGYQWSQVIISNGTTLALHQQGDAIDLGKDIPDEPPLQLAVMSNKQ